MSIEPLIDRFLVTIEEMEAVRERMESLLEGDDSLAYLSENELYDHAIDNLRAQAEEREEAAYEWELDHPPY